MTDWEEIYTQLKEEKTIYGIAETMNKEQADNYFNWLGNKYPTMKMTMNLIQRLNEMVKVEQKRQIKA